MNIVAMNIDPTTVQVRSRDTEHAGPSAGQTQPWSAWSTIQALASQPGSNEVYTLVFLLASQLMAAGNFAGTVTVSCNVTQDGQPDRTIDYEIAQVA